MKTYLGNFLGNNKKIAIVIARFNEHVTQKLLNGACDMLLRHNVLEQNIQHFWVPGSLEIPFVVKKIMKQNKFDGILTLGCIIRGETSHYDIVCSESTKGIAHLSLISDIPIILGILTTDTVEQALDRAGLKAGNQGSKTALSLLEMMNLNEQI